MKREYLMLLVGLVAGYLLAMILKKMMNNGSSYIFTDTQAKKLYSTDKLTPMEVIGLSGATGDTFAMIPNCEQCKYFSGTCTYDNSGAYSGCQFSDRWIGKDQAI